MNERVWTFHDEDAKRKWEESNTEREEERSKAAKRQEAENEKSQSFAYVKWTVARSEGEKTEKRTRRWELLITTACRQKMMSKPSSSVILHAVVSITNSQKHR